MTKTEYYQLNQWTAADRVLMEDFNRDNAKIDTALYLLQEKPLFTKLKTITTTEDITGTTVFDMDVSDVDWGMWQYVYMDLDLKGSGYMLLYPNQDPEGASSRGYGSSTSYDSLAGMLPASSDSTLSRVTFQTFCSQNRSIRTQTETLTGKAENCTYAQLETLHLIPDHNTYFMSAGSTISFWGVR